MARWLAGARDSDGVSERQRAANSHAAQALFIDAVDLAVEMAVDEQMARTINSNVLQERALWKLGGDSRRCQVDGRLVLDRRQALGPCRAANAGQKEDGKETSFES
jgi:hypothetical protein